jgi:ParB family chromosome partitioning protein
MIENEDTKARSERSAKAPAAARRGLGRGLSALIPQAIAAAGGTNARDEQHSNGARSGALSWLDLRSITLNPRQPRKEFRREELDELTASIREHGVLQPIMVRKTGANSYELVAGERRFRAASAAGLTEIPAIVRDEIDERSSLALALIENIQREDLNPIETARAYERLLHDFDMTQAELAESVGKSQPGIANTLRLLLLPAPIQDSLKDRAISEGHAKVILSVGSTENMLALWTMIVERGLTVRQAESAAAQIKAGQAPRAQTAARIEPDPYVGEIGQRLSLRMGTKVRLVPGRGERGVIEIAYYDHDQLEGLIDRLGAER